MKKGYGISHEELARRLDVPADKLELKIDQDDTSVSFIINIGGVSLTNEQMKIFDTYLQEITSGYLKKEKPGSA